jgi:hypothetical protein
MRSFFSPSPGTTMPPRWLCVVIVGFWLSTNGWLFYHDLWPHLQPSQPPPFSIDLVDEVQTRRPHTLWTVKQNDQKVFTGQTHIEHPSPQVFELCADFKTGDNRPSARVSGWLISKMTSRYRIDTDGQLRGLEVTFVGKPEAELFAALFKEDLTLRIHGTVEQGKFRPHLQIVGVEKSLDLPAVEVPRGAGLLLPLHPLGRLRDLKPGQQWRLPVFDPLADSLLTLQGSSGGLRYLVARVRSQPEWFSQGKRQQIRCLVVDYQGDDQNLSLWVDERTGQVLRQEAFLGASHWVMDRD